MVLRAPSRSPRCLLAGLGAKGFIESTTGGTMKPTTGCGVALLLFLSCDAHALILAQRQSAANTTAQSTTNYCYAIRPYYFEIGDTGGAQSSGTVPSSAAGALNSGTPMNIASASKWMYAAYAVERYGATHLLPYDIKYLTMTSGYHLLDDPCDDSQTVYDCLTYKSNDKYIPEDDGYFYYDGAHFEVHAVSGNYPIGGVARSGIRLGNDDDRDLAPELENVLGLDLYTLGFTKPVLAEGVYTEPTSYAIFLRKILNGTLQISSLLGSHAVCTNTDRDGPYNCPTSLYTPIPEQEAWHYSLGHWVEDDPNVGDGAFSSAGAHGFYPWVWKDPLNPSNAWYGMIARDVGDLSEQDAQTGLGEGWNSALCGRQIRKAWLSGTAQTSM